MLGIKAPKSNAIKNVLQQTLCVYLYMYVNVTICIKN